MTIIKFEEAKEDRLDVFLSKKLSDFSRSKIQKIIKNKEILVNKKEEKGSYILKKGDEIEILDSVRDAIKLKEQNIPLNILFEDDNLIVLNKPKGILTHPTPNQVENTLVNALLYHCKENLSDVDDNPLRRGIVHRLDKNTAGLILIAKTNKAHISLKEQIGKKEAIRKYVGVVYGNIEEDNGIIDLPLKKNIKDTVKVKVLDKGDETGKDAITMYKVLERFDGATYLEFELKTGRTHQIRAHMAHLNHPLVGDTLYGSKGFKHKILSKIKTNEQVLQSYYLKFKHPITCDTMEFELKEYKWDKDIINVLKALREN